VLNCRVLIFPVLLEPVDVPDDDVGTAAQEGHYLRHDIYIHTNVFRYEYIYIYIINFQYEELIQAAPNKGKNGYVSASNLTVWALTRTQHLFSVRMRRFFYLREKRIDSRCTT
jgi:hypothetical protein